MSDEQPETRINNLTRRSTPRATSEGRQQSGYRSLDTDYVEGAQQLPAHPPSASMVMRPSHPEARQLRSESMLDNFSVASRSASDGQSSVPTPDPDSYANIDHLPGMLSDLMMVRQTGQEQSRDLETMPLAGVPRTSTVRQPSEQPPYRRFTEEYERNAELVDYHGGRPAMLSGSPRDTLTRRSVVDDVPRDSYRGSSAVPALSETDEEERETNLSEIHEARRGSGRRSRGFEEEQVFNEPGVSYSPRHSRRSKDFLPRDTSRAHAEQFGEYNEYGTPAQSLRQSVRRSRGDVAIHGSRRLSDDSVVDGVIETATDHYRRSLVRSDDEVDSFGGAGSRSRSVQPTHGTVRETIKRSVQSSRGEDVFEGRDDDGIESTRGSVGRSIEMPIDEYDVPRSGSKTLSQRSEQYDVQEATRPSPRRSVQIANIDRAGLDEYDAPRGGSRTPSQRSEEYDVHEATRPSSRRSVQIASRDSAGPPRVSSRPPSEQSSGVFEKSRLSSGHTTPRPSLDRASLPRASIRHSDLSSEVSEPPRQGSRRIQRARDSDLSSEPAERSGDIVFTDELATNVPQPPTEPEPQEWSYVSQLKLPRGGLRGTAPPSSVSISTRGSKKASRQGYVPLVEEEEDESGLPTTPSNILPNLQDIERKFFELVVNEDVHAVHDFLQENRKFNINCVNFQGMSALHLAIQNNKEEIVKLLLEQPDIDIGDSALHAVSNNQADILIMILDHLKAIDPALEFAGCTDSPDFPDGTTPLLLAAKCGHYEMIGMLMQRGHSIPHPHPPGCFCVEVCQKQMSNKDGLMVAVARLDLYRAVSNPAYLCHSSDDPILTAFQLGHALRQWAYVTSEFRAAYLELASETRKFCVDLIASCRSSEEVELILRRRAGCSYPGEVMFPRLMLAMDYNQKEFVAHPNTQQVLEDAWHGDWHTWRSRADILKTLTVIPRICMLPIITIMCLFVPTHRLVRRWQLPINKLLSSVASYIVFLIIVFLESNLSKIEQKRGPPNSGLEPILVVYVVAFVWRSIRMYIIQGPRRFFTVLSNWYDCIWQLLFCITFLCWIAAYLDVKNKGERDLERKYWHYLDPTLIAEGFFTAAAIMAFARILLLCQLNYHLGPLQVSLGKMVKDIAKFVVIYFLLILAFAAGLCRFYEYYDGMVQEDKATGNTVTQVSSFVSFEKTLKTLFWALFCMSPVESADVVIENLPGPTEDTTVLNHHRFTEAVGHVAFALFEVVSVIIILNMLIATICSTFQKVTDNVDVEWTFGRTATYLLYMSQTTLPPPFNLLPTPLGIGSAIRWCRVLVKPTKGKKARFNFSHCCHLEVEGEDEGEKKFPIVMAQLIQRYYRSMEKQQQQESGDRTELQTLRQENESLRASLREAGIPK